MASLCTPPNNSNKKYSHIDTNYDYSSPILKRATKPLLSETAPSSFKYCPILSNIHLMSEPYCDTCWAMKGMEQRGYDLHLLEAHNYACPNRLCPLQFVEPKHVRKHVPICGASLLLQASRKTREKAANHNLINFPKQIPRMKARKRGKRNINTQLQVAEQEQIWITCYPDTSYCASKLRGYDTKNALDAPQCNDATYIDPGHHPPVAMDDCYFNDIGDGKNECKSTGNSNHNKAELENESDSDYEGESSSSDGSDSDTESEHDNIINSSDSDEDNRNKNVHDPSNNNNSDKRDHNGDVGDDDGGGDDGDTANNNHHNHNHNVHGSNNNKYKEVIMIDVDDESDDNSSLATFPSGKSTENNAVHLVLPNLDLSDLEYGQVQPPQLQPLPPSMQSHNKSANYAGFKRKAKDMVSVNDNINVMEVDVPPFKKQRLLGHNIGDMSLAMPMPVIMNNDVNIPKIATSANAFISNMSASFIGDDNQNESGDMKMHFPSFANPIISSCDNGKFHGAHSVNATWNRMSTHDTNLRHNKPDLGIKSSVGQKRKPKKKKKSKKKRVRSKTVQKRTKNDKNVIIISDDSESDNDNVPLSQEWCKLSKSEKFQYIFHPFHIYSVSQQFVLDKNEKKSKKKKKKQTPKKKEIKSYYKLDSCTAEWRERDLNSKWNHLQPTFEEMQRNNLKSEKFNGSEISFEFLSFVQIVPFEDKLKAKHVIPCRKLAAFLSKLFISDPSLKYLDCYEPAYTAQMQPLFANNSGLSRQCRIFLYSFLRCGVGYLSHGFSAENVTKSLHIHNTYYAFLNNHFKSQSVYKNFKLRDIEYKKDNNVSFKEFVFRNNYNIEDYSNCTIDLSLKMGGIICDELENLLEQNVGIQSLKTLYNSLYPSKQLRLVNIGFFQSPATNPGQNWHTDFEFTSIHDRHTALSPVVTVIVSLVKQRYDEDVDVAKTSGSTVFCLGSNHCSQQIQEMCKKYPVECEEWLYRVIQPVLDKGDIACFAGHTMHFGGAYNHLCGEEGEDEDRVVLYGILHLLPKEAKHDEYLTVDMNIMYLQQTQSLFGGGRYAIVSKQDMENNDNGKDEDEDDGNPYFVKKNRWRDRKT